MTRVLTTTLVDPEEDGGIAVEPLAIAAAGLAGGIIAAVGLILAGLVLALRNTAKMERRIQADPRYR